LQPFPDAATTAKAIAAQLIDQAFRS